MNLGTIGQKTVQSSDSSLWLSLEDWVKECMGHVGVNTKIWPDVQNLIRSRSAAYQKGLATASFDDGSPCLLAIIQQRGSEAVTEDETNVVPTSSPDLVYLEPCFPRMLSAQDSIWSRYFIIDIYPTGRNGESVARFWAMDMDIECARYRELRSKIRGPVMEVTFVGSRKRFDLSHLSIVDSKFEIYLEDAIKDTMLKSITNWKNGSAEHRFDLVHDPDNLEVNAMKSAYSPVSATCSIKVLCCGPIIEFLFVPGYTVSLKVKPERFEPGVDQCEEVERRLLKFLRPFNLDKFHALPKNLPPEVDKWGDWAAVHQFFYSEKTRTWWVNPYSVAPGDGETVKSRKPETAPVAMLSITYEAETHKLSAAFLPEDLVHLPQVDGRHQEFVEQAKNVEALAQAILRANPEYGVVTPIGCVAVDSFPADRKDIGALIHRYKGAGITAEPETAEITKAWMQAIGVKFTSVPEERDKLRAILDHVPAKIQPFQYDDLLEKRPPTSVAMDIYNRLDDVFHFTMEMDDPRMRTWLLNFGMLLHGKYPEGYSGIHDVTFVVRLPLYGHGTFEFQEHAVNGGTWNYEWIKEPCILGYYDAAAHHLALSTVSYDIDLDKYEFRKSTNRPHATWFFTEYASMEAVLKDLLHWASVSEYRIKAEVERMKSWLTDCTVSAAYHVCIKPNIKDINGMVIMRETTVLTPIDSINIMAERSVSTGKEMLYRLTMSYKMTDTPRGLRRALSCKELPAEIQPSEHVTVANLEGTYTAIGRKIYDRSERCLDEDDVWSAESLWGIIEGYFADKYMLPKWWLDKVQDGLDRLSASEVKPTHGIVFPLPAYATPFTRDAIIHEMGCPEVPGNLVDWPPMKVPSLVIFKKAMGEYIPILASYKEGFEVTWTGGIDPAKLAKLTNNLSIPLITGTQDSIQTLYADDEAMCRDVIMEVLYNIGYLSEEPGHRMQIAAAERNIKAGFDAHFTLGRDMKTGTTLVLRVPSNPDKQITALHYPCTRQFDRKAASGPDYYIWVQMESFNEEWRFVIKMDNMQDAAHEYIGETIEPKADEVQAAEPQEADDEVVEEAQNDEAPPIKETLEDQGDAANWTAESKRRMGEMCRSYPELRRLAPTDKLRSVSRKRDTDFSKALVGGVSAKVDTIKTWTSDETVTVEDLMEAMQPHISPLTNEERVKKAARCILRNIERANKTLEVDIPIEELNLRRYFRIINPWYGQLSVVPAGEVRSIIQWTSIEAPCFIIEMNHRYTSEQNVWTHDYKVYSVAYAMFPAFVEENGRTYMLARGRGMARDVLSVIAGNINRASLARNMTPVLSRKELLEPFNLAFGKTSGSKKQRRHRGIAVYIGKHSGDRILSTIELNLGRPLHNLPSYRYACITVDMVSHEGRWVYLISYPNTLPEK